MPETEGMITRESSHPGQTLAKFMFRNRRMYPIYLDSRHEGHYARVYCTTEIM